MADVPIFARGNYQVGSRSWTGTMPAGISVIRMSVDRTYGAFSLNGQPASTNATLLLEVQVDGVWGTLASVDFVGGNIIDPDTGLAVTVTDLEFETPLIQLASAGGWPVRATLTVRGARISASATLSLN